MRASPLLITGPTVFRPLGVAMKLAARHYGIIIFTLATALLHISLMLRIIGDLGAMSPLQRWGGLLNVCAILLFLAITGYTVKRAVSQVPVPS